MRNSIVYGKILKDVKARLFGEVNFVINANRDGQFCSFLFVFVRFWL